MPLAGGQSVKVESHKDSGFSHIILRGDIQRCSGLRSTIAVGTPESVRASLSEHANAQPVKPASPPGLVGISIFQTWSMEPMSHVTVNKSLPDRSKNAHEGSVSGSG